ncbi:MAG: hypothetical protein HPM95_20845 [Alphaproteobacteria bacterium]|nr:hypothetical protein [Alphaproteobacteria bacterium]
MRRRADTDGHGRLCGRLCRADDRPGVRLLYPRRPAAAAGQSFIAVVNRDAGLPALIVKVDLAWPSGQRAACLGGKAGGQRS